MGCSVSFYISGDDDAIDFAQEKGSGCPRASTRRTTLSYAFSSDDGCDDCYLLERRRGGCLSGALQMGNQASPVLIRR
jgi:hypothetical protein